MRLVCMKLVGEDTTIWINPDQVMFVREDVRNGAPCVYIQMTHDAWVYADTSLDEVLRLFPEYKD